MSDSTPTRPPRAFICHASEDKERFAIPFARALRANGADAWVDTWEIQTGDSLPQKIFQEGLGTADAIIPIISLASITKPWVTAELDVAIVRKIKGKTRLLPVILDIDDDHIPVALQGTRWTRITDPNNFSTALDEITNALFNRSTKPPIDLPPTFTDIATPNVPPLTQTDQVVLKLIGDESLAWDNILVITEEPRTKANDLGIPPAQFNEALEILEAEGYLTVTRTIGGGIPTVQLTGTGGELYCRTHIPNYEALRTTLIHTLVNTTTTGALNNQTLAHELNAPPWLISQLLTTLAEQGFLKLSPVYLGYRLITVYNISPRLKRLLDQPHHPHTNTTS
jgi:hypothetical protein